MGENKKAPQAKIFVVGIIFTPKITKKCKKKWPTENTPPLGGGTDFGFNLGIHPAGGLQKIPPSGEIYPLLFSPGLCGISDPILIWSIPLG